MFLGQHSLFAGSVTRFFHCSNWPNIEILRSHCLRMTKMRAEIIGECREKVQTEKLRIRRTDRNMKVQKTTERCVTSEDTSVNILMQKIFIIFSVLKIFSLLRITLTGILSFTRISHSHLCHSIELSLFFKNGTSSVSF